MTFEDFFTSQSLSSKLCILSGERTPTIDKIFERKLPESDFINTEERNKVWYNIWAEIFIVANQETND